MTIPRYPAIGSVLMGKYCVASVIGEGGMGIVLKARHIDLDEDIAIKCLLPDMVDRPEVVARFLREAKAAAKLKGEHITRVFDVGRLPDRGVPYMVMEYLQGSDLNAIIKEHGRQDPKVAVDLMLQACEAIAEAHSLGIIHRDLKGSNLFITQATDEPPQLKVLDFGIATAVGGESDLTNANSVLGTPGYMAPEQTAASRTVDARADIWSLGIVLYELLDGKRPFRSDVYYDLCLMIRTDPPPPLTAPDLPDGLEAVARKCLEKARDDRYQRVAELADALVPFATNPATAASVAEHCARLARRSGRVVATPSEPVRRTTTPIAIQPVAPDKTPPPRTPVDKTPPPKTPSSINASSGELSSRASRAVLPVMRSRRVPVGLTALAIFVLGGAGLYLSSRSSDERTPDAPDVPALRAPSEPVPVAPPPPTPTVTPPARPTVTPPARPTVTPPAPTTVTPPTTHVVAKPVPLPPKPTKPKPPLRKKLIQHKPKPEQKPEQKPDCQLPTAVDPFDPRPVCKH